MFISEDLTRFSRTSLGKAEHVEQDFNKKGRDARRAPSDVGTVKILPPSLCFLAGVPLRNLPMLQGISRPERVRHPCPLAPLPPCAECAGPLPVRPVWVVASLGAIADPARHTACGPPRGPDPKRLRAGPAGRPGQGRVITTLPVACRVRSRSSPSTARSSGRTWLTCGVKAPSANQPNSLAMLAVSTSGRKAR